MVGPAELGFELDRGFIAKRRTRCASPERRKLAVVVINNIDVMLFYVPTCAVAEKDAYALENTESHVKAYIWASGHPSREARQGRRPWRR